ncbi:MAG: DUF2339 domain-containing protein [Pseudomonadota bacterium]
MREIFLFLAVIFAGGTFLAIIGLILVLFQRTRIRKLEAGNRVLETRITRLESLLEMYALEGLELEDVERAESVPAGIEPLAERPGGVFPEDRLHPSSPFARDGEPGLEPEISRRDAVEEMPRLQTRQDEAEPWWAGLEESIGKRWTTWAGAVALFISAGFFVKYAFENEWLGPTGRIALGLATGIVLLLLGDQALRRPMRALGQGLMGGGLAILYISLFAAFSLYDILPQIPAFAAMVVVTAAGMALAILHDEVPLSFLALLGGFLTPLMVSTGQDARDALFAYLVILDVGVLGICLFKKWRAQDILAFLCSWALFAGWFVTFYREEALVPALAWLAAFFLIFLIVPFVYQIRSGTASSVESFTMALANAVVTFAFAYWILRSNYQYVLGFAALAMAACYVLLAVLLRRRVPEDARALFGFVGLSVVFTTLAVPLHLKLHGVTMAWAVEGPVLLYLGYVYAYRPVRIAGFIVLALATVRLFYAHWPLHTDFYTLFLNRHFAAAMFVPATAAVYAIIHQRRINQASEIDRYLMVAAGISAGWLALVIMSGEVGWWMEWGAVGKKAIARGRYLSYCAIGFIWACGAAGFLAAAMWKRSKAAYCAGLVALGVALIVVLAAYSGKRYEHYLIFLNLRFAVGILSALAAAGFAWAAYHEWETLSEPYRILAKTVLVAASVFPLALLSTEAYTYCREVISSRRRARWTGLTALSVVWGVYAVGWLIIGFWKRIREFRVAALGLLAIVALKVVLVDMSSVQQIYRIISFVVLGVIMISASYLYHRLEKRLAQPTGDRA